MSVDVDVVVIGGGPTGENVADRVVRGGLTAAVVEHELVGGECSYWACIPSKALLHPGRAVRAAQGIAGAAAAVTGTIDAAAVLARRDDRVAHHDDAGQVKWLTGQGITLLRGHARLAGPRRVEVASAGGETTTIAARHAVVISTGTVAAVPEELRPARPWTSREATAAGAVPGRLVVVGGGPVACELAQAWRSLGSEEVTVLARSERLLGRMEPRASDLVTAALRSAGIDVRLRASVEDAHRHDDGTVTVTVDREPRSIVADELLAAVGRRPATADLGLDRVGLEPGSWLAVDDSLRVEGVEGGWLYAAGDVNHRTLLTHMGKYQARVCGDVIVARARGGIDDGGPWSPLRATADHAAVPQVVFTDPEVAAVGLTEAQARDRGLAVRVVDHDMAQLAAADLLVDDYTGWARLVVDDDRRVVVGATFVGPDVADLVHSATVAVVGEVPLDRLWHAVPSFPTMSEVWLRLLEAYGL